MSAAAVKLPLSVKKTLRDSEPENKTQLAKIEKVLGFPVTFTPNVEELWTVLNGNDSQANLADALPSYLKSLREGIERDDFDVVYKDALKKYWTTKNITFTIEKEDFDGEEYLKENPNLLASWNLYNGLRFVNGDLNIYTKIGRFWSNVDYVYQTKWSEVFKNAPEELPLAIRVELRDEAKNVKAVTERIAKAVGVDAVKWDVEADAKEISKRKDIQYPFSVYNAVAYLNALATCLENKCADEMVKEAVVDAFGAKTVGLKVYDSNEGLKGLEVHSSYNGIQFLDGAIYVFAPKDNFCCNIDQVGYEHDIIKLF